MIEISMHHNKFSVYLLLLVLLSLSLLFISTTPTYILDKTLLSKKHLNPSICSYVLNLVNDVGRKYEKFNAQNYKIATYIKELRIAFVQVTIRNEIPLYYFFSSFLVDDTQALSKSTVQQLFAQTYAKIMASCFPILNVFFPLGLKTYLHFTYYRIKWEYLTRGRFPLKMNFKSHHGFNFKHLAFKGLVIQRWGTPGRWDNLLRRDNPPIHIISYFSFFCFFAFLLFCKVSVTGSSYSLTFNILVLCNYYNYHF